MLVPAIVTLSQGTPEQSSLFDRLRAAKGAGFREVEVFDNDLKESGKSPESVKRFCNQLELNIIAYQPIRFFEAQPADKRDESFANAREALSIAKRMGAESVVVCLNPSPDADKSIRAAVTDLRILAKEAGGMKVALEPLSWSNHNTLEAATEIMRATQSKNVGLVVDTFHLCSLGKGSPFNAIHRLPAEQIHRVHVSGAVAHDKVPGATYGHKPVSALTQDEIMHWSRNGRCELTDPRNVFPMRAFFKIMTERSRDTVMPVSCEIFRGAPIRESLVDTTKRQIADLKLFIGS